MIYLVIFLYSVPILFSVRQFDGFVSDAREFLDDFEIGLSWLAMPLAVLVIVLWPLFMLIAAFGEVHE